MNTLIETLYQNLLKLPKARLEQENLAVVLPMFTIPRPRDMLVATDCVNMYEEIGMYEYRFPQYAPRSINGLASARSFPYISSKECPISSYSNHLPFL